MRQILSWSKQHLGWVVAGFMVLALSVNASSAPLDPQVSDSETEMQTGHQTESSPNPSVQSSEQATTAGEVQAEMLTASPFPSPAASPLLSPYPSLLPSPRPSPIASPRPISSPKAFVPAPVPVQPAPAAPVQKTGWSCNCKKTCPNLTCAEAQFQLNQCGCSVRDGDNDGLACDAQCS